MIILFKFFDIFKWYSNHLTVEMRKWKAHQWCQEQKESIAHCITLSGCTHWTHRHMGTQNFEFPHLQKSVSLHKHSPALQTLLASGFVWFPTGIGAFNREAWDGVCYGVVRPVGYLLSLSGMYRNGEDFAGVEHPREREVDTQSF